MNSIRLDIGSGVVLEVTPALAANLSRQLNAVLDGRVQLQSPDRAPLPDEHVLWQRHSGGPEHAKPEWRVPDDLQRAESFYGRLHGKARVFLDTLLDHPGVQLSVDDIVAAEPAVFTNSRSIAGAINGLRKAHEDSGRRYPFYWWEGTPTRYSVKPSVAGLFVQARDALR